MKQTSTEWLFEKLWETPKDKLTWNALLEQAKEMDKEEFQKLLNVMADYKRAKQYYKETYGK